jgi:alkylhydroperoxidase family enzyme
MTEEILIPKKGWIINQQKVNVNVIDNQIWFKLSHTTSKLFGRNEVPDIIKLLSINPNIFWRWLVFASRLMPYGQLTHRERELIILRVAWLSRSRYEWGQHIEIGQKKAKLTDQDIIKITKGAEKFQDTKEQLLLKSCDEFIEEKVISSNTWSSLTKYYNNKLIIEINMLIGHYQMLAGILNSAGLQLEPTIEAYYQKFNERIKELI